MTFSVNQRVSVAGFGPHLDGVITGFGTSDDEPIAIVELDKPRWTEDRMLHITVLVVHFSNLEAN